MTRLLITGGSSYLGQHLVPLALKNARPGDTIAYSYYSHDPLQEGRGYRLDLRDGAAVATLLDEFRPDAIIHTAGSNRPADTMDEVIRLGARHVTEGAARHGARLVHLSTDVLFDGHHPPYRETDDPRPIHAYGRAKAAAEETVATYSNHVIVRTSLIYGLQKIDRGTAWIVDALKKGEPVTLFTNQVRNPVWVRSLSLACLELLALSDFTGVLHVAGSQSLSRADFALRLLKWWNVDNVERVALGLCDGERWPLDVTLDISKASSLLQTPLPGVDEIVATQMSTC